MTFFEPLVMSKCALRNELFISPYCTARYNALKMTKKIGVQIDIVITRRDIGPDVQWLNLWRLVACHEGESIDSVLHGTLIGQHGVPIEQDSICGSLQLFFLQSCIIDKKVPT